MAARTEDAWTLLDAGLAEQFPDGVADGALSQRARVLEHVDAARRRGDLSGLEQVAMARAALELANRAMSIYAEALLSVRGLYLDEADEMTSRARAARGSTPVVEVSYEDELWASRWSVAEVAAATGISEYLTRMNLDAALTLAEQLPGVRAAFAAGELELSKVRLFADAVIGLTQDQSTRVEADVLPRAALLPASRLKAALAEVTVTGADAADRARSLWEDRHVRIRQLSHTMAELVALLPAEQAAVVNNALVHLADAAATPDDPRTLDQLRADTLVDVVLDAVSESPPGEPPDASNRTTTEGSGHAPVMDSGGVPARTSRAAIPVATPGTAPEAREAKRRNARHAGRRGRRRPLHAIVTVPLSTFLAQADDAGSLAGHGPVPGAVLRDLLADATWQCAVVDDAHGTLLGLGRSTYTSRYVPGQGLVDHVTTRDVTCRFPGCSRTATGCEIDHLVPHPRGSSCSCNTGPLCAHHHRLKHEAGWHVERSTDPDHPPGSLTWVSPRGSHHHWLAPPLTPALRHLPTLTAKGGTKGTVTGVAVAAGPLTHEAPPF